MSKLLSSIVLVLTILIANSVPAQSGAPSSTDSTTGIRTSSMTSIMYGRHVTSHCILARAASYYKAIGYFK